MAGKRIAGITIELNGNTTKLESALKKVDAQVRNTQTQLRDVDKLLKLDPGNTELLTQKYEGLKGSIEGTKGKLDVLREAEKQMSASGATDTAEWDALQREIIETEQKLKGLNDEMDRFGSVSAQKVAAAGEKVKDVGGKLTDAGKAVMPASAALIGLGTAATAKFAEVDKTLALVNSTMKNTDEEAALLNKAMSEAAANSTFGMSDAAEAALNFARAGLDARQAADTLAPAMNLAAGEGGDLSTVSAGLVATINGFHGSFEEAGRYADVFAAACNNSALDVNSLSNAMSVAAPVFSSAGYSVEDAALYMGVMANNGIEAGVAANSLKTGLARLVAPTGDAYEVMKKLGIEVTNADGSMKDSVAIQAMLHDSFSTLSESEQLAAASAIFGKNQMAPWLALINTAPTDVNALSTSLTNCKGTTDEMADAMMNGFGGSIEKLKSSLDVLLTNLGQLLADYLTPIIGAIQGVVDWLNSLDEGTRRFVVTLGLIVAAAGPVLVMIGKVTSAVGSILSLAPTIVTFMGNVQALAGTVGSGLSSLWGIIAANPIGAIIAVIAGLIARFAYLMATSEEFRQKWINIWNNVKDTVHNAIEKIKSFLDFKWEWPKIPLPHINWTGKWSLNPPQAPVPSIQWYAKAMENGMILNSPTIFGMSGGTLLGGGEAGAEAVVGVDSLKDMIAQAVNGAAGASGAKYMTVVLQLDKAEVGRVSVPIIESEMQRLGVRLATT